MLHICTFMKQETIHTMKVSVWCVMILTIALEPVRGDAYRRLAAQHEKAVAMHTYACERLTAYVRLGRKAKGAQSPARW